MREKKNKRITILKMLWQRKYFYFAGYIIGVLAGLLSIALGSYIDTSDLIIMPISVSFPFGFIIYMIIREPKRLKKEGRYIILSREGLIHFALAFSSMIILGLFSKIIKAF